MMTRVIDSLVVLWGQTIMYTAYCLAIISLIAWFARAITADHVVAHQCS